MSATREPEYELPSGSQLKIGILVLKTLYTHDNPHHKAAIELIVKMADGIEDFSEEATQAVLGGVLVTFLMYVIQIDYNGQRPDKTLLAKLDYFELLPRTHLLYDLLKKCLNITPKNKLGDVKAWNFITQYHAYANHFLHGEVCALPYWGTKQRLLDEIATVADALQANSTEIKAAKEILLRRPATYSSMQWDVKNNPKSYQQTIKDYPWLSNPFKWKRNQLHPVYLDFAEYFESVLEKKPLEKSYKENVLLALNMYFPGLIKLKSYNSGFWCNFLMGNIFKPSNSQAFTLFTNTVNEKFYKNQTPDTILTRLADLRSCLNNYFTEEDKKKWDQRNGEKFGRGFSFQQMEDDLKILDAYFTLNRDQLSRKEAFAEFVLSKGIKYGLMIGGTIVVVTMFPGGVIPIILQEFGVLGTAAASVVTIELATVAPKIAVDGMVSLTDLGATTASQTMARPIVKTVEAAWEQFKNYVSNEPNIDEAGLVRDTQFIFSMMHPPKGAMPLTENELKIFKKTNDNVTPIPPVLSLINSEELNNMKKRQEIRRNSTRPDGEIYKGFGLLEDHTPAPSAPPLELDESHFEELHIKCD